MVKYPLSVRYDPGRNSAGSTSHRRVPDEHTASTTSTADNSAGEQSQTSVAAAAVDNDEDTQPQSEMMFHEAETASAISAEHGTFVVLALSLHTVHDTNFV